MCLSTPLLFLIFNRPDTTRIVFDEIRKQKPRQLFIAADGPRLTHSEDVACCQQTRSIIENIDWPCEVHTLFRDHNLGCGRAVSEAITWFFSHVEQGIILEDDCVPDATFFDFCSLMLNCYRDDTRVMMIAGTSYLFNKVSARESYFFSRYYSIWGWATWRRAWALYDFKLDEWAHHRPVDMIEQVFDEKKIVDFWARYFDRIVRGELDTWDVQWAYTCIKYQSLCVVPFNNLISNIGYYGAHGSGKSYTQDISRRGLQMPYIVHPKDIVVSSYLDKKIYTNIRVLQQFSLINGVKQVVKKIVRW